MKNIFLLGPFERYNYGDLIFPNVLTKMLENRDVKLHYYGYKAVDLSEFGGYKTCLMSELYKPNVVKRGDVLIVVGGDTLAVNFRLVNYQLGNGSTLFRSLESFISRERGLQKKFKVLNQMPWLIDKENFSVDIKVGYNAVGGLNQLNSSYKSRCLKQADYVSIRDSDSGDFYHAPDCAFIMSDLYKKDELIKLRKVDLVDDYIIFQVQASSYFKASAEIVDNLIMLASHKHVYLLVIGYAAGHDDMRAYNDILKKVDTSSNISVLPEMDIFQIMDVIAHASCFIGSSLHGNLTAKTYLIPHIGIDRSIKKLRMFYENFGGSFDLVNLNEFYEFYLKLSGNVVEHDEVEKIKLDVYENFSRMFSVLEV